MSYILYHPVGGPSAKALAVFMGMNARMNPINDQPDWLIRWGSSKSVPFKGTQGTLNWASSLGAYKNRLAQLRILREGGVNVPLFCGNSLDGPFNLLQPSDGIISRDFPKNGQNTGGDGIQFHDKDSGFVAWPIAIHDMYMVFIPKERQFRVHVIRGQTRVREVMPDPQDEHWTPADSTPIWNLSTGFTYRVPQFPIPATVVPSAVQAVAALKLDFGAVDVITIGPKSWVLEVNTAPGLHETTLKWYAEKFACIMGVDPTTQPGQEELITCQP